MVLKGIYPVSLDVLEDGETKRQFDKLLEEMLQDVIDRKHNRTARKVSLSVTITPEVDENTGRNAPKIQCEVKISKPGYIGRESSSFIENGQVKINVHDLHGNDPSQPTIMNLSGDPGNVREVGGK